MTCPVCHGAHRERAHVDYREAAAESVSASLRAIRADLAGDAARGERERSSAAMWAGQARLLFARGARA